jgi:glucose-1-phosphate thymidylyltransferase
MNTRETKMKGIILAGGNGTRLLPLTKVLNKHLLPIYNKPMIYYPVESLVNAGIEDIMIVTGGNKAGDFLELIGNGRQLGAKNIHYTYQYNAGGIADALRLTEDFADGEDVVVILGDNIIEKPISPIINRFIDGNDDALLTLKSVKDPSRFGVATLKDDKIESIEEKPIYPSSNYAVIGLYIYDNKVYNYIEQCEPSDRGELEISDVNNFYIKNNSVGYYLLDGWWTDAGTIESYNEACRLVAKKNITES